MLWFRILIIILLAVLIVVGLIGLFNNFWGSNVKAVTTPISEFQATSYLQQFGYMDKYTSTGTSVVSAEAITSAIKDFQKFAGIPVTGELDDATTIMMNKPRCGVKDRAGDDGFARMTRYIYQGSRWSMNNLTYRVSKYPSNLQNKRLIDNEILRAFKVWSDVSNLEFTNNEKEHVDLVHIDIQFEKGDHGHGIFDGQAQRTLAHAFSPHCGSDAHFNDEEQWTVNEEQGINLFQVAAHEFGHSLGLDHSNVLNSVMAPFYEGYDPGKTLTIDDIRSIQALYGRPNKEPAFVSHAKPRGNPDPSGPDLCEDPSFDALTIIDDGRAFAFKDDFYWEIEEPGIVSGPRKISEDWAGLPGNIDTAMTWTDRKTYFFKDDMVYRFKNQRMDSGYPKPIGVVFPGIPDDLGAAFVWSGNGKAYFFKGHLYWRFDNCKHPTIISYYPLQVNGWKGVPNNIDTAVLWKDQKTYFFKEDKFYRFDDKRAVVDQRLSTADFWLNCTSE